MRIFLLVDNTVKGITWEDNARVRISVSLFVSTWTHEYPIGAQSWWPLTFQKPTVQHQNQIKVTPSQYYNGLPGFHRWILGRHIQTIAPIYYFALVCHHWYCRATSLFIAHQGKLQFSTQSLDLNFPSLFLIFPISRISVLLPHGRGWKPIIVTVVPLKSMHLGGSLAFLCFVLSTAVEALPYKQAGVRVIRT